MRRRVAAISRRRSGVFAEAHQYLLALMSGSPQMGMPDVPRSSVSADSTAPMPLLNP